MKLRIYSLLVLVILLSACSKSEYDHIQRYDSIEKAVEQHKLERYISGGIFQLAGNEVDSILLIEKAEHHYYIAEIYEKEGKYSVLPLTAEIKNRSGVTFHIESSRGVIYTPHIRNERDLETALYIEELDMYITVVEGKYTGDFGEKVPDKNIVNSYRMLN